MGDELEQRAGWWKKEEPVLVDAEVALGAVDAGDEVLDAGIDIDAAAAAVILPLRSHDFGGEPIGQIGRTSSHGAVSFKP